MKEIHLFLPAVPRFAPKKWLLCPTAKTRTNLSPPDAPTVPGNRRSTPEYLHISFRFPAYRSVPGSSAEPRSSPGQRGFAGKERAGGVTGEGRPRVDASRGSCTAPRRYGGNPVPADRRVSLVCIEFVDAEIPASGRLSQRRRRAQRAIAANGKQRWSWFIAKVRTRKLAGCVAAVGIGGCGRAERVLAD